MSKRILFFGNERLATGVETQTPALSQLLTAGYEVTAVVIAQDDSGRTRRARRLEIAELAETHHIPVIKAGKLAEQKDELAAFEAEAAVLVAFGKIVPQSIIDLFPGGIINIHPSLLPRHRGPTPLESVILKGEEQTGVSLMRLSAAMDAGGVYAQITLPLTGKETKQALADQLGQLGAGLLIKHLPAILEGRLKPRQQDDSKATYDQLIRKQDGEIGTTDWRQPASELERRVRAFAGWPRVRTTLANTEVIITEAHVETGQGAPGTLWLEAKKLGVFTGEDILAIDKLIPNGKKEMPAAAFLAGYRPA